MEIADKNLFDALSQLSRTHTKMMPIKDRPLRRLVRVQVETVLIGISCFDQDNKSNWIDDL